MTDSDETRSYNEILADNERLHQDIKDAKAKLGLARIVNYDLQKTVEDIKLRTWAYCPDRQTCLQGSDND